MLLRLTQKLRTCNPDLGSLDHGSNDLDWAPLFRSQLSFGGAEARTASWPPGIWLG